MEKCKQCGEPIDENASFCTSCGAPVEQESKPEVSDAEACDCEVCNAEACDCETCDTEVEAEATVEAAKEDAEPAEPKGFADKIKALNNTKDCTADFDKEDVEQFKVLSIFAYLSWLVLIPLFATKGSRYARYHANQGIVLAIVETIWWIIEGLIRLIPGWIGTLLSAIFGLVNIVFFVLTVIGILNAYNGRAKQLPIIGKFRILKDKAKDESAK